MAEGGKLYDVPFRLKFGICVNCAIIRTLVYKLNSGANQGVDYRGV